MRNGCEGQVLSEADRQTFHDLYLKYHRDVYRICLRMTKDVSESEDLTQDVFLHLFRTIGSFRGESAFSTWLHRLTVNIVLMHFRKRSTKSERTTESGELPVQVTPGSYHPERMRIVDRILLSEVMEKLPDGYREAVILYDIEGLGHKEIAKLKGRSDGTSKSQLHKGRAMLRALLTQPQPDRYLRKQSVSSIA